LTLIIIITIQKQRKFKLYLKARVSGLKGSITLLPKQVDEYLPISEQIATLHNEAEALYKRSYKIEAEKVDIRQDRFAGAFRKPVSRDSGPTRPRSSSYKRYDAD
jgi:hypothetical protein